MKNPVIWTIIPCNPLKANLPLGTIYRFKLQGRGKSQGGNRHNAGIKQGLLILGLREWSWFLHFLQEFKFHSTSSSLFQLNSCYFASVFVFQPMTSIFINGERKTNSRYGLCNQRIKHNNIRSVLRNTKTIT